jgi:hypothetical protein
LNTVKNRLTCALVTISVCLLASGCESISATSDYDRSFDFSSYHTFSWISNSPLIGKTPETSPLSEGRIENAVTDVLTQKGYRFVDVGNPADFVIAFTVGARQQVRVTSTPYPGGYGMTPHMWGRPYYQDIDVREFTEGRLAIDVFDTRSKQPVWHGHATKSITSADQKNRDELINKAVAAILKDFPPGTR